MDDMNERLEIEGPIFDIDAENKIIDKELDELIEYLETQMIKEPKDLCKR